MIWHHPTIREIDILLKLNSDHLDINLNHCPHQPIADTIAVSVVITKYLDLITDMIHLDPIGSRLEMELCQLRLLNKSTENVTGEPNSLARHI